MRGKLARYFAEALVSKFCQYDNQKNRPNCFHNRYSIVKSFHLWITQSIICEKTRKIHWEIRHVTPVSFEQLRRFELSVLIVALFCRYLYGEQQIKTSSFEGHQILISHHWSLQDRTHCCSVVVDISNRRSSEFESLLREPC